MNSAIELLDFAIIHRWIRCARKDNKYDLCDTTYAELIDSVEFMQKSGEFKEEILRFQRWIDFFYRYTEADWKKLWSKIKSLVVLVDDSGERYLKKYVSQLEFYLEKNKSACKNRDDVGLIFER